MNRILICLMCVLILLGGCSDTVTIPEEEVPLSPVVNDLPSTIPTPMTLCLSASANDSLRQAAYLFCDKVSTISNQKIEIVVLETPQPAATLSSGGGQLALISGTEAERFSPLFPAISSPFLYKDHDSISMAANSEAVVSLLKRECGPKRQIVPIIAYTSGSRHLVTTVPVDSSGFDSSMFAELDMIAVLPESSGAALGLSTVGFSLLRVHTANERLRMLQNDSAQIAEFNMEELYSLDWPQEKNLSYLHIYSGVDIQWLVVDYHTFELLTPAQQACIKEAASFIVPEINDATLLLQSQSLAKMRSSGVDIYSDATSLRRQILAGISDYTFPAETYNLKTLMDNISEIIQ